MPDGAIPEAGRKLRCSQCKHQWHQLPVTDEPSAEAVSPSPEPEEDAPAASEDLPEETPEADDIGSPEEEADFEAADGEDDTTDFSSFGIGDESSDDDFDAPPIRRRPAIGGSKEPKKKRRSLIIGAIVAVLLLAVPGTLIGARAPLVAALPAMSPLFDAIGLHVPVTGEFLVIQNVGAWRKLKGDVEVMLIEGEILNDSDKLQTIPVLSSTLEDAAGNVLISAPYTPEETTLLPNDVAKFKFEIPKPDPRATQVTITFSDEARQGGFGY